MLRARRVHLEQGVDDEGALAALHTFTQCADFDVDFLYLAALVRDARLLPRLCTHLNRAQESQSKSALRCAQEAYTLLYRNVSAPGSSGASKAASSPGYFAQLLVRALLSSQVLSHGAHSHRHRHSATSSKSRRPSGMRRTRSAAELTLLAAPSSRSR